MQLQECEKSRTEISQRYDIVLELLGEREEQLEDMKDSLEEAKLAYKEQLQTLCQAAGS